VLVRRWGALAVALGLVGLVVVLLWTPVLGVRSVDVVGVRDLTGAQVRTAADVRAGTPMLRLDTLGITARVGRLPRVAFVDVSREWPSTVRITVTERDPVGVLTASDGTHLIDSTGFDYATVATPPAGLPKILLPAAAPADPRTQAVVRVLAALPTQLRAQLTAISAATPGSVTLALADGKTIRWGDADDSARKAAVLAALMTRPGKIYDVSSPELPTIS
jgi:cell division protein FtsQ